MRINEITSLGMGCTSMAPDLPEVVFSEGEAQRLQEPGNLRGRLIGQIGEEGKARGNLLIHCLRSLIVWF